MKPKRNLKEWICKLWKINTLHKKMNFFIKDFFNKCNQIRSFLRIRSHLLKNFLMENFIFVQRYYFISD